MKEDLAPSSAELGQVRAERDLLRSEAAVQQSEIARHTQALEDAEQRFDNLFERTQVGLAVVTLNGQIRECNAAFAAVLGVAPGEALRGRRIISFTHLDDRAEDADVLTTLSLGARERAWIAKRGLDGTPQLLLYYLTRDEEGEPATIVVRDASELLSVVDGLRMGRSTATTDDEWREQLAAVLRHELRTPVGLITGFTAMLEHELSSSITQTHQRALEGIAEGGARLTRLTRDLDAFVCWSTASPGTERPIHAPGVLAARALAEAGAMAEKAGVTLVVADAEGLPAVACDDAAIGLALNHLFDNAIVASARGGTVVLRLTADAEGVSFAVEDEGPGVPEEAREAILQAFRQLRMDPARDKGGVGLGLAVVQAIAEAHGGTVTLADAPSGGASAQLKLPPA